MGNVGEWRTPGWDRKPPWPLGSMGRYIFTYMYHKKSTKLRLTYTIHSRDGWWFGMLPQPRMYKKRQKSMVWHLEISLRDSNLNLHFLGWLHRSHWGETVILSFWKWLNLKRKRQKHTVFLAGLWLSKKKHDTHLTIANFGEKAILQLLNCEFQILQSICGFWFASPLVFINLTRWGWPIHRRPLGCHDTMGIGKANKFPGQTVREVAMAENWAKIGDS